VVSIVWSYNGLNAQDMSDRIVSVTERTLTTTVDSIEHIESQSLNGIAVVKVFFQPTANVERAIAQVTAISQTQLRQLPQGTTPPLVISYSASSVPILQLALSGGKLSEQQLNDYGLNFIRTRLITVDGASVPYPYGGKQRQVQIELDTAALQSKGLSPLDVVNAVNAQNLILPSGTAKISSKEYDVDINGSPTDITGLNQLPIKTIGSSTIYIHDVGWVRDGFPPQTNIVRVDGQRSVLLTIQKAGNASTLDVISGIKSLLPQIKASLPPELDIKPLADQSIFVRASIDGVIKEATIAACLTGLMILIFLGSWRSTLIIAVSIPLSILTSIIVLSALGETINIMTLGGLALAVGILVDDATVEIEKSRKGRRFNRPFLMRTADRGSSLRLDSLHMHCVRSHVFFDGGRAVSVAGAERVVSIMGTDESDLNRDYISWVSPLGRALMKSAAGDSAVLQAPGGTEYRTVLEVFFKRISLEPFCEPPGSEASAKGLTRRS
jgi:multidrug efflux pump subunit AcrB